MQTLIVICIVIAAFVGRLEADRCSQGRGLSSNNVLRLYGSGDTLWMDTWKDGHPALNMIEGAAALADPTKENNWWSYNMGCRKWINGFAFGNGIAIASLDSAPNIIWTYSHATSQIREHKLKWPDDGNPERQFGAGKAVRAGRHFYFACLDGGVLRFAVNAEPKIFIPGRNIGADLSDSSLLSPVDSSRRVMDVEVLYDDSVLVVATPKKVWLFHTEESFWDSVSITGKIAAEGVELSSFSSVFVNRYDPNRHVYGTLEVRIKNEEKTVFCKYLRSKGEWQKILDKPPKALSFAPEGFCYMLFDEGSLYNIVRLYKDTTAEDETAEPLRLIAAENRFSGRMTKSYDIDIPEFINDILFVSRSDSGGYLWIATSEGLFFSRNETPSRSATDTTSFILVKRAPAIDAGLKKSYARPGILTPAVTTCKFIYNISDTALVTIKVYDYNMDLVKTVIERRRRVSGQFGGPLGRSTVESEDYWDGTNGNGRPVAPGVYYYKITTDKGERAFGKIVVAR